jgi:hypothetical protein
MTFYSKLNVPILYTGEETSQEMGRSSNPAKAQEGERSKEV